VHDRVLEHKYLTEANGEFSPKYHSIFVKTHTCKSPESDRIQNYLLEAFQTSHRRIKKNFSAMMEKPEKIPE
jgi:hypothetical protein